VSRSLKGMSVLVTGGGSGIGAAVVARLVGAGARVTLTGRRADKIAAVAEQAGEGALAVAADVTDAADRQRMVEAAVAHGGGLEVIVHGAANMYRGTLEELD
jgi:3-oxoacyl-[acyl-carrier protein] reductase